VADQSTAEVLIDGETFDRRSTEGRGRATDAMFERRLVRRGRSVPEDARCAIGSGRGRHR
jgi:hypothetical protein